MNVSVRVEQWVLAVWAVVLLALWLAGLLLVGVGCCTRWGGHAPVDWVMHWGEED